MLVQFTVRNFKTFKEEAKLTLFASNYDKTTREEDNVFEVPKFGLRLLKSAVVYGANASGKTKLMDAAYFMKEFILKSSKESQQGDPIETEPFRLSTTTIGEPSMFEVVFIHNNEMFRYGFEATAKAVTSEWLYHRPHTKEVEVFFREGQKFTMHNKLFRKGYFFVKEKMVRPNALMLSVAAQFNDEMAEQVFSWLQKFHQLAGLKEESFAEHTMALSTDSSAKNKVLDLLKEADLGIEDIQIRQTESPETAVGLSNFVQSIMNKTMKEMGISVLSEVKTFHGIYDLSNAKVGVEEFTLDDQESSGTAKFFALIGPIIKALDHGEVLFVDELDSKIHPNLVGKLVALFNSAETNPKNAQLIFNTHDTNLLGSGLFRRDQIWFVEKDRYGAASLYSLASFKTDEGGRKSDNFEENYISGRYGAIPILGDFDTMFHHETAAGK
ncbi:MAG: ATP-binding protein [Saprospiraceae bacterium]|nr:ATP-binding protein [Saprospiraceae bacterium]